jgi:tungstate transport system substrate-binding protein
MKSRIKNAAIGVMIFVVLLSLVACSGSKTITLATTTSTNDSGLLDYLLPEFKKDTGIEVKVVAVGTGQALEIGRKGDADVLMVHAKADEEKFVEEGYGVERFDLMYNDFILVGPTGADHGGIKGNNIIEALKVIKEKNLAFISRGDDSGTHKLELKLWEKVDGSKPEFSNYLEVGQGMGKVLTMTNEKKAYTLTDRATYLSMKDELELEIVVEGDENLFNQYGIIAINDKKFDGINRKGADKFIEWLLSEKGQNMIKEYGVDKFGQSLFVPNAK